MIVFTHRVTDWKNLLLDCSGHSGEIGTSLPCAAASALMAAAVNAMEMRHPPRLEITCEEGHVRIRCEYNQHTAEIAMTTICGFEWLAQQAPGEVRCERMANSPKKK